MTGTVGWFARNKVAANLFMAMILAAGLVTIFGIPLDKINSNAPVIDGRLDDGVWARAQPITGFVQREPVEGEPVSERTEVRIVADEEALYVGAWL